MCEMSSIILTFWETQAVTSERNLSGFCTTQSWLCREVRNTGTGLGTSNVNFLYFKLHDNQISVKISNWELHLSLTEPTKDLKRTLLASWWASWPLGIWWPLSLISWQELSQCLVTWFKEKMLSQSFSRTSLFTLTTFNWNGRNPIG